MAQLLPLLLMLFGSVKLMLKPMLMPMLPMPMVMLPQLQSLPLSVQVSQSNNVTKLKLQSQEKLPRLSAKKLLTSRPLKTVLQPSPRHVPSRAQHSNTPLLLLPVAMLLLLPPQLLSMLPQQSVLLLLPELLLLVTLLLLVQLLLDMPELDMVLLDMPIG